MRDSIDVITMDVARGIALVGTEATALSELRSDGGGVKNPDMMNSANKKARNYCCW